jgi:hypothetical protein
VDAQIHSENDPGLQDTQSATPAPGTAGNGADPTEAPPLPPIEIAAKTLTGDLRDLVLSIQRESIEPWHRRSETQQRYFVGYAEAAIEVAVGRAVQIIAAGGFPAIAVTLEQLAFKPKGIEAKLAMNVIDRATRHQLVDAQGKPVLIVIADPAAFIGARGPARIDKQAPELPLDEAQQPNGEAIGPLRDAGEPL